jgi:aspartokinase-like uncharacterized kinase
MRMRHIVICGLSGFAAFSRIISQAARLKQIIEHKMGISSLSTNFVSQISHSQKY